MSSASACIFLSMMVAVLLSPLHPCLYLLVLFSPVAQNLIGLEKISSFTRSGVKFNNQPERKLGKVVTYL